jgi:MerR family redox-sensitive transcriptional activator SoxR
MTHKKELSIGEVARHVGARPSALRYYERVGLIPPAPRMSRRRVYDASVFESLAVIQLAKDAGFTIDETKLLLTGFAPSIPASTRWRSLADAKIEQLSARIERAERMRGVLECRIPVASSPISPFQAATATRIALIAESLMHAADHYGQIVEYLRMNGVVPPASRR